MNEFDDSDRDGKLIFNIDKSFDLGPVEPRDTTHFGFDSQGRLTLVFTTADPNLNSKITVIENPPQELVEETQASIAMGRLVFQKLEDNRVIDLATEEAIDSALLREMGIDPS